MASSLHKTEKEYEEQKKRPEKGKQIAQYSRRPVTRATTNSTSVFESTFKGIDAVNDERNDLFPELDQLQDLPETRDSKRIEEEYLSFGISSKYIIKLRKPQDSIDLNLPATIQEYP